MPRQIPVGDAPLSSLPGPKQALWDLPTRLFHWLLVALVAFSWWSAKNDEIGLHIGSGITILGLLIFRVLWGFFGSSTARFSGFVRGPKTVLAYLKDRGSWRSAGHTPLGALSIVTLLGLLVLQVSLGLFNADEDGFYEGPLAHFASPAAADVVHELHELNFDILLAFIALHVGSILFYRLVEGKKLTKAMITGRGALPTGAEPMRSGRWWTALLCLAIAIGVASWIYAGAPPL